MLSQRCGCHQKRTALHPVMLHKYIKKYVYDNNDNSNTNNNINKINHKNTTT